MKQSSRITGPTRRPRDIVGVVGDSDWGGPGEIEGPVVRAARRGELAAVAGLRWSWVIGRGQVDDDAHERERFVQSFVDWATAHEETHFCVVAVRDDDVIGAGWLAVTVRVPEPGAVDRTSGDVQAVYVRPEERDRGVGSALIAELLAVGHQRGVERVTVHSSHRALPAYRRCGFSPSDVLLQATPDSSNQLTESR